MKLLLSARDSGLNIVNASVKSIIQPDDQKTLTGYTDSNGELHFTDVKTGYYAFEVTGDYFESSNFNLSSYNSIQLEFVDTVKPLCDLRICVTNDQGEPLRARR